MALLGNLLWLIFGGGIISCIGWLIAGVLMAISIIGLPFAPAAFRIAQFSLLPFGHELVDARAIGEHRIPGTALANLIWILFAGIWLALEHLFFGILLCLTIIGIPFGMAHFKLASVSFAPLGKRIV